MNKKVIKKANLGLKFDDGKIPWGLLPWDALIEVARVLQFGARKYKSHNWRGGMEWSRNLDAALGHIIRFLMRVETDKESGLNHLAHGICDLLFVLSYFLLGSGIDDRWKTAPDTLKKLEKILDRSRPLPKRVRK